MSKIPPVIGITGRARSGKDTVADSIVTMIGGYRYSFADPIRAMLVPLGIDMAHPYWQANKEKVIPALNASPRRLMQTLGTEWGRDLIDPNIWLTLANQRLITVGKGMVIPDVRFENEAEWVRSRGGKIIHVHRPDAETVEAHTSEAGISPHDDDSLIINDGTLDQLRATVKEVVRGLYQA